jgi:hypothetical protein
MRGPLRSFKGRGAWWWIHYICMCLPSMRGTGADTADNTEPVTARSISLRTTGTTECTFRTIGTNIVMTIVTAAATTMIIMSTKVTPTATIAATITEDSGDRSPEPQLSAQFPPISPAVTLIANPSTAALKRNDITVCAVTTLRIAT